MITTTLLGVFAPGIPTMAGLPLETQLLPLRDTLDTDYEALAAAFTGEAACLTLSAEQMQPWQDLNP